MMFICLMLLLMFESPCNSTGNTVSPNSAHLKAKKPKRLVISSDDEAKWKKIVNGRNIRKALRVTLSTWCLCCIVFELLEDLFVDFPIFPGKLIIIP